MWRSSYSPTETSFPPPQCFLPQRTTTNTQHSLCMRFAQHQHEHRRSSIVDRRTMAAAANSIISSPTLPTLPTAWSLIEYAIGYKDMQHLSKMEGYSQSFGQAKFWLWKQPILHGNDNIDIMIFSPYLIDFIGFKSYHELHLYTKTNKIELILTKLWLGKVLLWNTSSQPRFSPSRNFTNIQLLALFFTQKRR